jgi:hypothetical protein
MNKKINDGRLNNRITFLITVVTLMMSAALQPATAGTANVEVITFLGPRPDDARYVSRANAVVDSIYHNTFASLPERLEANYITSSGAGDTNWTLWFAVHVTIPTAASPYGLTFTEKSADVSTSYPNGLLSRNLSFPSNQSFTPQAMGVTWGAGGQRANDTTLTNYQDWSTPVNELIFAGAQSVAYYATNATMSNNIVAWLDSGANRQVGNFEVSGAWSFNGVTSTATLLRHPMPTVSLIKFGKNLIVTVSSPFETALLQQSDSANGSSWTTVASTAGAPNGILSTNMIHTNSIGIFRAVIPSQ